MEPVGHCRVCGSTDLTFLFSLGEQYVNDFVEPGQHLAGTKCPIELELCRVCSLVQARYTVPQELLYSRHYWYRSGVTNTMRNQLKDVVIAALHLVDLKRDDIVLDIGSNDGTLLRLYPPWLHTVGVEPANNLVEEGRQGVRSFIHDFWSLGAYTERVDHKARIITALGMFYDLDDPNKFIHDVAAVLHPDGVFIAQLMCLRNMIDQGDVGNLCHEHLEFYSLRSLHHLYKKHGLRIIDIERNIVNGGSYRIYACKQESTTVHGYPRAIDRLNDAFANEVGLDQPQYYDQFIRRMVDNKQRCVDFIQEKVAESKTVWAYGASTKGNIILQYYGLDTSLIGGAADRSPEKHGKVTIGTGIPIWSEEDARQMNPDYFLVLPYAFINEFIDREQTWHNNGGRFIVPLPEFKVI